MVFTLFGRRGVGGSPKGLVHNRLIQFVTLDRSKIAVFETCKACCRPYVCVFHLIWVLGGGGSPKGLVHNLLM